MAIDSKKVKQLYKNKVALAVLACIVLGGVGTAAVMIYTHNNTVLEEVSDTAAPEEWVRELNPVEKAHELSQNGDYDAGQKLIDDELMTRASNDGEKREGYIQKALFAMNNDRYDEAMGYAKEADTMKRDRLTVRLLGQIAETAGDTTAAAGYYQAVLDMYSEDDLKDDGLRLQQFDDKEALARMQ